MSAQVISVKWLLWAAASTLLWTGTVSAAPAGDLQLEAQLIWGTNDPKSPDPRHKPVEAAVAKRLKSLPFKWSNYFEVNRKRITVKPTAASLVPLSGDCEISVARLDDEQVELILFGKGKLVGKVAQKLPKGELLVMGGNAPNFTGWFVVLKLAE
jgi:hypothetical protein